MSSADYAALDMHERRRIITNRNAPGRALAVFLLPLLSGVQFVVLQEQQRPAFLELEAELANRADNQLTR